MVLSPVLSCDSPEHQAGKRVVTMPKASTTVYQCPGCGKAVEPGEDYVIAREYQLAPEFSLHMTGHAETVRAVRRFHVEHFRGRMGDYVYELVHEASR
jgi:hypothetical protein